MEQGAPEQASQSGACMPLCRTRAASASNAPHSDPASGALGLLAWLQRVVAYHNFRV